jgi:hypothetical protein
MLDDDVGLFLRVFVKNAFQFGMNGALAAVGHDDGIELLARFIENDFVVSDKGIFADAIRSEVRLHVMPVEARSADGYRRGTISLLVCEISAFGQIRHMVVYAVVVIKKAVSDVENGFWGLSSNVRSFGFRLREKIIRYRDQKHQRKKSSEGFVFERRIKHTTPPFVELQLPEVDSEIFKMHVYRRLAHSVKAVKMSIEVQTKR